METVAVVTGKSVAANYRSGQARTARRHESAYASHLAPITFFTSRAPCPPNVLIGT